MDCPAPSVLDRLALGLLSDDESSALEEHLAECETCLRGVADRDSTDTIVEALRDAARTAERRSAVQDEINRMEAIFVAVRPAWLSPSTRPTGPMFPSTEARLGRYQVTDVLGEGGYGVVYRAYDPELRRVVAIKVPRGDVIGSPADAEAYINEARVLAALDHPGIVPVLDVGRAENGHCFVVSKYTPGGDLAHHTAHGGCAHDEAVELAARVAEALHYAHQRGLVHRDIKPGNILLDEQGRPLVADFGSALTEGGFGQGQTYCGTPAYMSPEQARGEGHRVDARSDIYSLGVVFYELLAGRRPYRHEMPSLLDEILEGEIRPPRQLDHTIPKELERICLKALAKRAADRYTTAIDLAEDLRHWKETGDSEHGTAGRGEEGKRGRGDDAHNPQSAIRDPQLTKVVPKGLRSFDAHDADFFLQLLPGPTDRDGLPESIRFWKTRVEEIDADQTFAVGLIYGPSGCGKSSLIKAGLLPRLGAHVIPIYLEAAADDTEARLLKLVGKQCPGVVDELARVRGREPAQAVGVFANSATVSVLVETLAALRRGRGLPSGQKALIVLDQFEQWLHAHRDQESTELVRALRHCDGAHVQCVVMVRDDFVMAASRFMRELEIPLVEGENSAAADLFNVRHAKRVLALFGRAYGCLAEAGQTCQAGPGGDAPPTPSSGQSEKRDPQETFLDQSVAGLAEDGRVVSVRLALFAEMVKNKPWTPATLKEIGGIAGVGATFLEETFSAATAPPRHRQHLAAARGVLKALLPEAGADIKGHRRDADELLAASGYERRPVEFAELMKILDGELRLVTPADDEGAGGAGLGAGEGGGVEHVAELERVRAGQAAQGAGTLVSSATAAKSPEQGLTPGPVRN